ncbi:SDR family NAD(P)-dependent oxidoreductase [Nocardioides massiliensis]|uniref:NAD(P)-dependent dehydrogenase (Short-subunit alcohol dehydrogenase family) n=1 Tax=Nocardioides massiliensis TaxID=1325935 RepID=A0ABT9NKM9_9ACTN|nr:SDR family oxidoreductase [Nocardioides massiliensis]MDP9820772.1 NAD(P)-dependent dehydrogenase (short-subunit alcohol dehydrogenase family) [Nocardioides massiliensis]
MSIRPLVGKVALVTGGTRGLGRQIAAGLATRGATVIVAGRDGDRSVEAAAAVARETGGAAFGMACHVGRWVECDALVERVIADHRRLDILVNNAGMSPLYDSLEAVTEEYFDKVIAVNLKGPFRLSVNASNAMVEGGAIVNISSIAAVRPYAHQIPYALAKAGLNTLTVAMAHACGPKVRVNAVMAGPFLTDASAGWDMGAFSERAEREIPLRRAGAPEEIVGAVAYLVGPDSGYTTGAVLKVDGGEAWSPS